MASLITLLLEPLHASTLLFCHSRLLLCSSVTPGSPPFFYPYRKYQKQMYMVYKLLSDLFLPGQIQSFCSLVFWFLKNAHFLFLFFSSLHSLKLFSWVFHQNDSYGSVVQKRKINISMAKILLSSDFSS